MGIENVRPGKGVPITLDKERHLRFTFAGLGYLAAQYGSVRQALDLFDRARGIGAKEGEKVGLTELSPEVLSLLVDLAYAGLMHEDAELRPPLVAEIIELENVLALVIAIGQALTVAMPAPKGGEADPQKA